MIGIWVGLVWTASLWAAASPSRRMLSRAVWAVVIAGLMICAARQTAFWKNSEALWTRSLACNPPHHLAINNLGNAFFEKGHIDEALARYEEALRLKPNYALARNNLGNALFLKGRIDEAITNYEQALQVNPAYEQAHNNLGNALLQKGRIDEAIAHLAQALFINPDNADAHYNLGNALLQQGRVDEAIPHYSTALRLKPGFAEAHNNLSFALIRKGRFDEAIANYQKALLINPGYALANNNFAWLLATCSEARFRDGAKATEFAQRANQLTGENNPVFLRTLAAACAESGKFVEAKQAAARALEQAVAQGSNGLADTLRGDIKLYETGLPCREPMNDSGQ
jgi:tetratricopeptide (TPR) repeat protein